MCAKTLKSFARKQASEEQNEADPAAETPPADETTAADSTETDSTAAETETTETEETGESDGSETESTAADSTAADSTDPAASAITPGGGLKPGMIAVNASELKAYQEKAAKWDANEGKLNTLQAWYDHTIQIGATAKEDITTNREKGASTVASQPWNQAAQAIADKYHS